MSLILLLLTSSLVELAEPKSKAKVDKVPALEAYSYLGVSITITNNNASLVSKVASSVGCFAQ